MKLNDKQQEAIDHIFGPLLILAGAGSGKTTVLAHRGNKMIASGVDPASILCVTFTNKATDSLRQRIVDLSGEAGEKVWVSTFHGFGRDVLNRYKKEPFTIASTGSCRQIVKEIIQTMPLEGKDHLRPFLNPKSILELIALMKSELVYPSFLTDGTYLKEHIDAARVKSIIKDHIANKEELAAFRYVYQRYQNELTSKQKIDVDDILMETVRLFVEDTNALKFYQTQYRFLMVDEYQDTNRVQYLLINALAKKDRNLAVVGDDFQSIYGFRGGDIRNILSFTEDYPEALEIKLEENYRSTRLIVQAANEVIAHNPDQKEKTLYTSNDPGEKIHYMEADFSLNEAERVAEAIKERVAQGVSYRDIAIFYRHHADSSVFESVLSKEGIPYVLSGEASFFDRKEIKDVLAYFRFFLRPEDAYSFRQVINCPTRGIGATSIQKLVDASTRTPLPELLRDHSSIPRLNAKTQEGLHAFYRLFERYQAKIKNESASAVIRDLLKDIEYERTFEKLDDMKKKERKEHLRKLIQLADEFEQQRGETLLVVDFMDELIQTDVDALLVEDEFDRVNLLTIHASKGLEFPVVFLTGMKEGGFPSKYAVTPQHIEEERRLCYVAFTRAKKVLYLSYPLRYMETIDKDTKEERASVRSRFLSEFSEELLRK